MAEYPINKGIGRPVEFKGLKAQYLFLFAGGLLAAFILFLILYMAGAGQWLCRHVLHRRRVSNLLRRKKKKGRNV